MKPGIKTSEFWVTVCSIGAVFVTFAQQNCDLSADKLLALAMALVGAVYTASRTWIKVKAM